MSQNLDTRIAGYWLDIYFPDIYRIPDIEEPDIHRTPDIYRILAYRILTGYRTGSDVD